MKLLTAVIGACVLAGVLNCPVVQAQKDNFPADDEIKLVMTQTQRALVEYEAAVKLQEKLMGTEAGVEDDKRLIEALKVLTKGMSEQPQRFNSSFGFDFVTMLDDASRNAALCNGEALKRSIQATVSGKQSNGEDFLLLSQNCNTVSGSFYTVSENAAALYRRYLKGEEDLGLEAFNTPNECTASLKKLKPAPAK